MSIKEEIIDYELNKCEVDKWISLKGEAKYMQFVDMLKAFDIPITWQKLSDTYRYDKRLLVNLFKYMSFFEEFLRAQIWNNARLSYSKLEWAYIGELMDQVIIFKDKNSFQCFSVEELITHKEEINYLRNRISHNKIMLNSVYLDKNINLILQSFYDTLPQSYKAGFKSDINKCNDSLEIPDEIIIVL